jgi:hypothetical protein
VVPRPKKAGHGGLDSIGLLYKPERKKQGFFLFKNENDLSF